MRLILVVCLCVIISGCSAVRKEPPWPWADGIPCSKPSSGPEAGAVSDPQTCGIGHVVDTYNKAQKYCIDYANTYENGGDAINSSRFWIATVGTLSGAVFAPVAGGSAKDAWAGLSGSTNALQSALNESFSNAVNIRRRSEIAKAGTVARQQVASAGDNLLRVLAAMDIAYDCKMAVGRADAEVAKALNELQKTEGGASGAKSIAEATPTETQLDAKEKAREAATEAATTAVDVPIATNATANEERVIQKARERIAKAAAESAAAAAASAATQTAQRASSVPGAQPTLLQTQAAAQVAAQVAAQSAAQRTAEETALEVLKGQKSSIVKDAVMQSTAPAAAAASEAAAGAAAATAAAPVQPVDVR